MGVVDLDRRAAGGMARLIDGVSDGQLDAPTPCPAWTVRDLVAHIVAGNLKYTEIGQGQDWSRGAPDVDLDDDPGAMYRRTSETMLAAWERPGVLHRETPLPLGRGPAELALFLHLGETLVHGWDLARATGQTPPFDDDVVGASLDQFRSWLGPRRPPGSPFADAQPVGEDAAPIDRLAGYLGRDVAAWTR
ncbi:MAG: TIGR03086 family metal-binding protein [Acidimicrobiia bacterium]